jgi:ATP-binding cassette subfamily C protein CydD
MLGARFHAGLNGVAAARRVFYLLHGPEVPAHHRPALGKPRLYQTPIRFHHVSYAYDDGDRSALHDVSLEIEPGKHLTIIGPSGAGKSTILRLLLGFVEPQQGAIFVGDNCLSEFEASAWFREVAWVPQLPFLFDDTIAANIRLGCPGASDDAVLAAAKEANAHDFIMRFPQGYETMVGEQGVQMSGGQVQRVALARAFLKDAPLLILDEPTTNLDGANEMLVRQALERAGRGRTVVTITHRLNNVVAADHVVTLKKGRIVAQGRPAELFPGSRYRPSGSFNGIDVRDSNAMSEALSPAPRMGPNGTLESSGLPSHSAEVRNDFLPILSYPATLRQLMNQLDGHVRWLLAATLLWTGSRFLSLSGTADEP